MRADGPHLQPPTPPDAGSMAEAGGVTAPGLLREGGGPTHGGRSAGEGTAWPRPPASATEVVRKSAMTSEGPWRILSKRRA